MKHIYAAVLTAVFLMSSPALQAQEVEFVIQDAGEVALSEFKWTHRVLVVFADSPLDPSFREQLDLLATRPEALLERDVVVITDTDPAARSMVRTELRPRGFGLVIVDKDGRVMLRKPDPWDVREITRAIDKTPLRQQEIQNALHGGG
ncbi:MULTISPECIES: DUF4174 domain-containing protein [Roseobacteraceae]|jgi:hypothetical protein|uniref:DUF4174 domain-containing protein n=1 Tax=Celeribacter baekdonensis B30 TaxID=1208323 RepID=K2IIU5_9RHOB|nr:MULTISPECIES: DUF4174 domain-containing protein [Roseobacteraceae]EKE70061.1 hypothetical protein B30_14279 [Celeribacter baekdonensis B30]KAB6716292.1 DUF4174 domain-containing protein [Roseobacter sp. TSBP12]|tara:strand:- start:2723 stop:3166 length:444 start_codon:yes stop_codon:yes gene_type:complete